MCVQYSYCLCVISNFEDVHIPRCVTSHHCQCSLHRYECWKWH